MLLIGRARDADLRIHGGAVAERHASATWVDERTFEILDLTASGGVMVNGVRTVRALVRPGDRLNLGGVPVAPGRILGHLARKRGARTWRSLQGHLARVAVPAGLAVAAGVAGVLVVVWSTWGPRPQTGTPEPLERRPTSPVLVGIVPVAAPATAPSSSGPTTESSASPAPVDHPPEPRQLEPSGDLEDSETIDLHLTLKQAEPGPIGPGLLVHVRVENQVGRPIENLGSGSFLLRRRAGEKRLLHPDDVAVVDSEPDGRAVFLVMDVSRSMVGEDRFPVACDLARGVVARLAEGDRAALVRCADTAELVLPLGGPADVAVALADLQVGGRTALWDSIGLAVATARGVPNAVVVVVTDGGDTISSRSLDEVLREAVEAEVRVVVAGTGLRPSERAGLGRLASETNPMDIGGASFMEQAGIEELARLIAGMPSVGLPWYRLTWSALATEGGVEAPTLIVRYRAASGIREDAIPLQ